MEAEFFYDEFASQEWERLERHRTECAVTLTHSEPDHSYMVAPYGIEAD